jgi:lipopolysaccharide export system permease protein
MIFNKIWERYFLREAGKVFFLFLFCFYGLYILIDYSSHAASFNYHHSTFRWSEIVLYYGCEFIKRQDILVPFAILVATVRTLCSMNVHNELVAMMASGIKLHTLLRPFVFIGICFTLLIYLSEEMLYPYALTEIKQIEDLHIKEKNKNNDLPAVQQVLLEDKTTLLYKNYDSARQLFLDVFWIKSLDEIYHMKQLYPYTATPLGEFVDYLSRNKQGNIVPVEHRKMQKFPEISFNQKILRESLIMPEDRSLTELWNKQPQNSDHMTAKESQILTVFYFKMAIPWLCVLAVIGPAPFCVRFTRQLPVFFIYACSVFGLIALYLLMDALQLLGKRQVLSPALAIWPIFLSISAVLGWRYSKIG